MVSIHRVPKLNKAFYKNQKKVDAEFPKIYGKTEFKGPLITLRLKAIQTIGTGET
jgi:hypothetical protein